MPIKVNCQHKTWSHSVLSIYAKKWMKNIKQKNNNIKANLMEKNMLTLYFITVFQRRWGPLQQSANTKDNMKYVVQQKTQPQ